MQHETVASACPDRLLWDHRHAAWRAAVALMEADAEFGQLAAAQARLYAARQGGPDGGGSHITDPAKEADNLRRAVAEEAAAAEAHYRCWADPADLAAVALINTPAPDLDAAIAKIDVIRRHELDNDVRVPGDVLDIVHADFRRLGFLPEFVPDPAVA